MNFITGIYHKVLAMIEQDFNNLFQLNSKGNYFSPQNKCTIYKAGDWYYCLTKDGEPKYGRKGFKSALECFEYLYRKHLISTTVSPIKGFHNPYNQGVW